MDTVTLPDKYQEGSGNKAAWMEERRQERVGKRKYYRRTRQIPTTGKSNIPLSRGLSSLISMHPSSSFSGVNSFTFSKSVATKHLPRRGTGATGGWGQLTLKNLLTAGGGFHLTPHTNRAISDTEFVAHYKVLQGRKWH